MNIYELFGTNIKATSRLPNFLDSQIQDNSCGMFEDPWLGDIYIYTNADWPRKFMVIFMGFS